MMVLGFVIDNPQQEYVCKADAAVAQTAIGNSDGKSF